MLFRWKKQEILKYLKYVQILALSIAVLITAQLCHSNILLNCMAAEQAKTESDTDERIIQTREREYINSFSSTLRILNCSVLEKEAAYKLNQNDYEVLLKIVEAEAGGEDENGKLLVANVVLNRVKSEFFPDTVKEVVYQCSDGIYQFSPVRDGRMEKIQISEETKDAVERALSGEDISQGALYFMARKFVSEEKKTWFDNKLTWLFSYGGHEFFE